MKKIPKQKVIVTPQLLEGGRGLRLFFLRRTLKCTVRGFDLQFSWFATRVILKLAFYCALIKRVRIFSGRPAYDNQKRIKGLVAFLTCLSFDAISKGDEKLKGAERDRSKDRMIERWIER